jgi:hypothetical protein
MAIGAIIKGAAKAGAKAIKKTKPKAPKARKFGGPKSRITPAELRKEVAKMKSIKSGTVAEDRNINRLVKKYDSKVNDFIFNETMRDLKAKGGRIRRKKK